MKDTFELKKNRLGFGWEIIDVRSKRKVIFHTSNKEQATSMYQLMVETENFELLPKPYTTWIPKLLLVRGKQFNSYYLLFNANKAKKIMLSILKERFSNDGIKRWDVPEIKVTEAVVKAEPKNKGLAMKRQSEIKFQEKAISHNYYLDALENIINNNMAFLMVM